MSNYNVWSGGVGTGDEIENIGPSLGLSPRKAPRVAVEELEDDEDRLSGKVALFIVDRGFGYIKQDNGEPDVWFHVSALPGDEIRRGQRVKYEVAADTRTGRTSAINLRITR